MNLRADFLRSRRASAMVRWLLAIGLIALAAAGFTCAHLAERTREAESALTAAGERLRALDAQRRENGDAEDGARHQRAAAEAARAYAFSFPWNDLFRALESLQSTKVVSLAVTVDAGVAHIELRSDDAIGAQRAVDHLKRALPDFEVVLARQHATEGRMTTMIEVRDRAFALRD